MNLTARERNLIRRVRRLRRLRGEIDAALAAGEAPRLAMIEAAEEAAAKIDAYALGLVVGGAVKTQGKVLRKAGAVETSPPDLCGLLTKAGKVCLRRLGHRRRC